MPVTFRLEIHYIILLEIERRWIEKILFLQVNAVGFPDTILGKCDNFILLIDKWFQKYGNSNWETNDPRNYSNEFLNIHGYTCLLTMICFGIGGLLLMYIIILPKIINYGIIFVISFIILTNILSELLCNWITKHRLCDVTITPQGRSSPILLPI